jgi:hypothetical protein
MILKKISLEQTVVQKEGNLVSDMSGEKVMLSINNGKYYNLGETGGFIWDMILEKNTVIQVIEKIIKEYHVEKSVCEIQVVSFLELLLKEDLISIES